MGIGIGGDYPLSAIISSEFAPKHIRGRMMTAVFACQGWGQLTAGIVSLVVVSAFKDAIAGYHVRPCTITGLDMDCRVNPVDVAWRLSIGLGGVPAAIALYFRLTIPETPRFTMDSERNVKQASRDVENFLSNSDMSMGVFQVDPDAVFQRVEAPKHTRTDFFNHFFKWKNGKVLLGTAVSWFALDTAFYGLGLNNAKLLGNNNSTTIIQAFGIQFSTKAGSPFNDLLDTVKSVKTHTIPEHFLLRFLTGLGSFLPEKKVFCPFFQIRESRSDSDDPGGRNKLSERMGFDRLDCTSVGNIVLSLAGHIPGYWATFFLVDTWGREPIQLMGFTILTIIICCLGE